MKLKLTSLLKNSSFALLALSLLAGSMSSCVYIDPTTGEVMPIAGYVPPNIGRPTQPVISPPPSYGWPPREENHCRQPTPKLPWPYSQIQLPITLPQR